MSREQTYEELMGRVKELENEVVKLKQEAKGLYESRDYLEKLFNYANAPIIVWDPEGNITRFNRAFERLTGHAASDVIGRKVSILLPEANRVSSRVRWLISRSPTTDEVCRRV